MFRGDDEVLQRQVLVNVVTGALATIAPGDPFPPSFAPQNITGWRIVATTKFHVQDPDSQAVWQGDNAALGSIVLTEPLVGKFVATQPALATRSFPDGPVVLVYDIKGKNATPPTWTETLEEGTLTVEPSVTRVTL